MLSNTLAGTGFGVLKERPIRLKINPNYAIRIWVENRLRTYTKPQQRIKPPNNSG